MERGEELTFSVQYYIDKVIERFIDLEMLTKFDAKTITCHAIDIIDQIQQHLDVSVDICLVADGDSVI